MSEPAFKTITEDEVLAWVKGATLASPLEIAVGRLTEILDGRYPLHEARRDVVSFRKAVP